MLFLNRNIGEKVVIDGEIIVMVSAVDGKRISIGFEAPSFILNQRVRNTRP